MDDVPKGIILVLLVITVLISVLGTWTVLDQVSTLREVQPAAAEAPPKQAQVGIKIIDPDAYEKPVKPVAPATGMVGLQFIEEPKGG